MVHLIARFIAYKIVEYMPCKAKNHSIFIYALEKIISQILIFLFLAVLSISMGVFIHMFVYIVFVTLLRGQTSGFHAKTPFGCAILSSLTSIMCIYFSQLIVKHKISFFILPWLLLASIYILRMAPINHILLDLTQFELGCHKKGAKLILTCEVSLILMLYLFPITRAISITASLAIITVVFFMVLSKIYNQEVKNYG